MEPRPVEIVEAHGADSADEELLEPPHQPRRWQLIAIATGLVVFAGLVVRVLASTPDDPRRGAAPATPNPDRPPTLTLRVGAPPDVFPVDPSEVHLFPVVCKAIRGSCRFEIGVPRRVLRAVQDRFGGVATRNASTRLRGGPTSGSVGFVYLGQDGSRTIAITVRPESHRLPSATGIRRTGKAQDVYARVSRGGYRILVDVYDRPGRRTAPGTVLGLARDPRLRP